MRIDAPNILRVNNLTSNGFVKTSGGVGTLSIDTATYETSLTKGNMTATSPILVDQTRQVIGGAVVVSHATTAGNIHLPTGGSTSQWLYNNGTSGTGAWSTATLPTTATGTGTILRADGTNWVATTATYPTTTTVSQVLYSTSGNVIGGSSKFLFDGTSQTLLGDNSKLIWGAGSDCSVYYDGTNMIINPKDVGTGEVQVLGNIDATILIHYENAFTFVLDANASTDAVTFPTAFANGITPVVVVTPEYQTSFWVTAITNTGFTFNVGTTNAYAQTINCIAMDTT